ncbi:extracellular solute-binding protein [Salibacterium salarium]|uniref:extracellular solute-binding protein n=1 Tax=Salibacterium salarium TaxID=284579 RepID=UPI001FE46ADE|nr:extracellular solute-binding protein [Salibacterium salarium]
MNILFRKSIITYPLFFSLCFVLLFGCSNEEADTSDEDNTDGETTDISILTTAYTPEPPDESSPAWQALEEYTNTNLDITFVPSSNWDERFNVTLASGDLPSIMLADKTPSFINAVQDGAFWNLTDHLDEYENLSQMNDIVKNNISIKGEIYSIPRSRPLGRNAVTIREDWLENVGLDKPETIDEFYEVLKAFTEEDPDGDGEDNTTGMVVSEYEGPWDIMQTWFGVPNEWGEDENGELVPDFMTDEYREALDFFNKIYEEGLVNEDFAVMDPAKWHDAFVNGEAGVIVDVGDAANRNHKDMVKDDPSLEGSVGLFGAVEGPDGLHNLPTLGYSSMLAISKTSVKTEEELHEVLEFLDKINTEEGQNLVFNGVEGRHYEIVDGEYIPESDQNLVYEYEDLNQILPALPTERYHVEEESELTEQWNELKIENEDIVVSNPAEPLVSEVYAQHGQQLDDIVDDARIKYIVGQIDEEGLDEAEALWKQSGGDDYIEEINTLYEESQN